MSVVASFVSIIESEFPADRLTWQKGIPTFHPQTADEAAKLFRLANSEKQRLFITGFGNNIDPVDEPFQSLVGVRTDRLNKVLELRPTDFFVKLGSGYPLREINRRLSDENLYLPHSALPYVGSVGGALAVGLSATLHGHDLPVRKYLIQAEIVTPEGDIITPGSVCFKSVSGYDIVKLFSPTWGVLGLVVSATFRVMPISGKADFDTMLQDEIDRNRFVEALAETNEATDAVYSRKIKAKFDPHGVLPVV